MLLQRWKSSGFDDDEISNKQFQYHVGEKNRKQEQRHMSIKKKLYKHSIDACDEMEKVGRQPEGQFLVWGEHCMDLWVNDWSHWQYDGEVS